MARSQPYTSKLAYEKIMQPGVKEGMYKKIITSLQAIGEGTSWDIAEHLGVKPDKCWKRNSELKQAGIIIDTGKTKLTPDGNDATVYALFTEKEKYKTTSDMAKDLIKDTLVQKTLFG